MVNLFDAIILGIVQGLTEWLPVSSSGHLVIMQQVFHMNVPFLFDVMLHFGTLLAVFFMFWEDILKIFSRVIKLDFRSSYGRLGLFLIIGTIPVAFFGYFLHDTIESLFTNLLVVGVSLIFTGCLMYSTKFARNRRKLRLIDSLMIGTAQALALLPGVSRSGSTISFGLLRQVNKESVFKFSFLLAIPAIIGANLWELRNAVIENVQINFSMLLGTAIAGIIGYISLRFLYKILKQEKFYLFSFYCWVVGFLVLIYCFL